MGKSKTVSAVKGKGSIRHNNRNFYAGNVDKNRTKDNIIYKQEPLREAYQKCFETAIEEYNSIQKRADRKIDGIDGYMEKIKNSGNGEKLFYETIFQVGNKHDSHTGTLDGFLCTNILDDYMKKFEERNPHLYVFNAVMHLDEETPHIHIDYIPIADGYKQGMQVRNSLDRAFKQQGIDGKSNKFENSTIAWENREKDYIAELMKERNIERAPDTGLKRKHKSTEHYKATAAEIENQVKAVEIPITARPNKLNKNEVIIKKDDFEKITERAKLSQVHEKATKEVSHAILNQYHNLTEYMSTNRDLIEQQKREAEAALKAAKEKEQAAAQLKQKFEEKYNAQLTLNENFQKLTKLSTDLVNATRKQVTKMDALKAENASLRASNEEKVEQAVKTATEPLQAQITALKEENSKLSNQVKTLSERLETVISSLFNTIYKITKAVKMLKYDKEFGYQVENLTPKQKRLIDGIQNFASKQAKEYDLSEKAERLKKYYGLEEDIREEIIALEPKPQITDKSNKPKVKEPER